MAKKKINKASVLYKIISALTLAMPTSITLIVSAIWSTPTPNVVMVYSSDLEIKKVEDLSQIITFEKITEKDVETRIVWNNVSDFKVYNVDFTPYENKVGDRYVMSTQFYIRFIGDDLDKVVEFKDSETNVNVATIVPVSNINIETGNKLSVAFIVSVIATIVVVMVVSNKMRLYRKYPRTATFITLLSITIILAIIEMIIGSILAVFITATISWGAYCLEYYYYNNFVLEETASEKKTSNLAKALRELDI